MRFLKENYIDDLIDILKTEFEISTTIKYIPSFLLPDGRFVYCKDYGHAEFDEFLYYENEISEDEYAGLENGMFTLSKENCVRLNPGNIGQALIGLPNHNLTSQQYQSLLDWLDMVQTKHKQVMVLEQLKDYPDDITYYFDDYTSDDIIKKIKRYYSSGNLYERLTR